MGRSVAVVGVALGALLLGACGPGSVSTPSVVPSPTCVDDGVRHAGVCSQADFDAQQREQAQFAEAKKVYDEFLAEEAHLVAAGGADSASPRMQELAEDPFLNAAVAGLREQKVQGRRVVGRAVANGYRVERSRTKPGAAFAVTLCEDGRATEAWDAAGKSMGYGRLARNTIYFKRSGDALKIWDADGDIVQECSA